MTHTHRWLAAGVAAGLLALTGVAGAQGQGQGRGQGQGGGKTSAPQTSVSATVVFRSGDVAVFRDYFAAHKITGDPLPPGIAKNLARGKPLPPGIAKKVVPSGLVALGPKLDRDTTLSIFGDVVVAMKGGVVIDIMGGVFKH
jgi:hypothetical protein